MNRDRFMGFYWGFVAGGCAVIGTAAFFFAAGDQWLAFAIIVVIATVANFAFGSRKPDAKDTPRVDRPEF